MNLYQSFHKGIILTPNMRKQDATCMYINLCHGNILEGIPNIFV